MRFHGNSSGIQGLFDNIMGFTLRCHWWRGWGIPSENMRQYQPKIFTWVNNFKYSKTSLNMGVYPCISYFQAVISLIWWVLIHLHMDFIRGKAMHVSRANDQPDGWFLEIYATLLEGKSWYDIYIYIWCMQSWHSMIFMHINDIMWIYGLLVTYI